MNRALILAGVALSFALVVTLGVWTQQWPPLVVPVVAAIAVVATFVCNSLRIGPPGAYMFALACAAGTAMPTSHLAVWQLALLVLSGGALSWVVHMGGALLGPRGPERAAVTAASATVARFAAAVGTAAQDGARHAAALALHDAWAALVTFQPARPRPDALLTGLRTLTRELHLLFAACVNAADQPGTNLAAIAERARHIGKAAVALDESSGRTQLARIPLGHLGTRDAFRENLSFRSPALLAAARVGIAAVAAGVMGAVFGLERAYWAMAAAVLVLHQGLDWTRTLQRGVERMSGTLVGLGLAGAVFAIGPSGLWLVATMMILQFLIEMLVTRNYALAVVFITAIALIISSGGHQVPDPGPLLWARGGDTVLGCVVGLAVHVLTAPRGPAVSIRQEIVRTLATIQMALACVGAGDVTTDAGRRVRRDLQRRIFVLAAAYEIEMGGMPGRRASAEAQWSAVAATQRLGYKVLAACWSLEEAGEEQAADGARALLPPVAMADISVALDDIMAAARAGTRPPALSRLPEFLQVEIENLAGSLVAEAR
ncbi:MAG TPA: FUSC family protein [Xanthobacteraceae bacterium]